MDKKEYLKQFNDLTRFVYKWATLYETGFEIHPSKEDCENIMVSFFKEQIVKNNFKDD